MNPNTVLSPSPLQVFLYRQCLRFIAVTSLMIKTAKINVKKTYQFIIQCFKVKPLKQQK